MAPALTASVSTATCPVETMTGNADANARAASTPVKALELYLRHQPSSSADGRPALTLPTDITAYVQRKGISGHTLFFHRNGDRADYEVSVGPGVDGGWGVTGVSVCS